MSIDLHTDTREDADTLVRQYLDTREPEYKTRTLRALEPTIRFSLNRFTGSSTDPVLRARAMALASNSLDNYNPEAGASVKSFVVNNLQPLLREKRKISSPSRLSERSQLDAYAVQRAEQEYIDTHGTEPDMETLADRTGLALRRINKIKSMRRQTPAERPVGAVGEMITPGSETDFQDEAMEYIYGNANREDKLILKHQLGYGGANIMTTRDMQEKFGMPISRISRRSSAIMDDVNKIERMLKS